MKLLIMITSLMQSRYNRLRDAVTPEQFLTPEHTNETHNATADATPCYAQLSIHPYNFNPSLRHRFFRTSCFPSFEDILDSLEFLLLGCVTNDSGLRLLALLKLVPESTWLGWQAESFFDIDWGGWTRVVPREDVDGMTMLV